MTAWGADSETGVLRHVLLGPPENFRWLPTSAISKATLESGASFDSRARPRPAPRAGLDLRVRRASTVHQLEPDPALPYQVFARDSSVMTPGRRCRDPAQAAVAARRVRAGDPLLPGERDPDLADDQRRLDRGRRRDDRRARRDADRQRRGADRDPGGAPARRVDGGRWAGRCGSSRSPASSSTSTCSSRSWRRSSPRSASSRPRAGWSQWLRAKGFEILEVSTADAFELGVNAISLGDERVISTAGSARLNEQMRALGLEVFDPDLSMFTKGGGGAHCLAQALDRDLAG